MKAFVMGVFAGAIACLGVVRISGITQVVKPELSSVDSSVSLEPAVQPSSSLCLAGESATRQAEPVERISGTAREKASDSRIDRPRVPETPGWIEELSEKEANEICSRANDLRREKERAKKDAEPKDPAWAYAMEMLIHQHVESQIPADQYTNLQIQCRTTFCELSVRGSGQEARDRVAKVLQEVERQPWSDVVSWGHSSGLDARGWDLRFEWHRPNDDEREFLFKLRDERAASTPN